MSGSLEVVCMTTLGSVCMRNGPARIADLQVQVQKSINATSGTQRQQLSLIECAFATLGVLSGLKRTSILVNG